MLVNDLLSIHKHSILEPILVCILVVEAFEASELDWPFELESNSVNTAWSYGPILFKFELAKPIKH